MLWLWGWGFRLVLLENSGHLVGILVISIDDIGHGWLFRRGLFMIGKGFFGHRIDVIT